VENAGVDRRGGKYGSKWYGTLPFYSVFAADTLLYAVTFTCDPVTLAFDL